MASLSYRSSRPDRWVMPRPHRDPSLRYMIHGPIRPMEEPGFWARLFGRRWRRPHPRFANSLREHAAQSLPHRGGR